MAINVAEKYTSHRLNKTNMLRNGSKHQTNGFNLCEHYSDSHSRYTRAYSPYSGSDIAGPGSHSDTINNSFPGGAAASVGAAGAVPGVKSVSYIFSTVLSLRPVVGGFFVLALLLFGCSGSEPATPPVVEDVKEEEPVAPKPSFVKVFEGKVAGQPVLARLEVNEGIITGEYYYLSNGEPLGLDGTLDDEVVMDEFDSEGRLTGGWKGTLSAGKLSGTWSRPRGEEKEFILLETNQSYSPGSSVYEVEIPDDTDEYITYVDNSSENRSAQIVINPPLNGKLTFMISVADASGCTGMVEGQAKQIEEGDDLYYYDSPTCKLIIQASRPGQVNVKESDCTDHGAGCVFTGQYSREDTRPAPSVSF